MYYGFKTLQRFLQTIDAILYIAGMAMSVVPCSHLLVIAAIILPSAVLATDTGYILGHPVWLSIRMFKPEKLGLPCRP